MQRTILSLAAATTVLCTTAAEAGTLYAVSEGNDLLVSIDTNTLVVTTIGPLRITFDFGGLAYDCSTGTMYMIGGRPSQQLYTVDLGTGAATPVGSPHGIQDLFGLAYDASRDTVYASQFTDNTPLWTMNRATGAGAPGPNLSLRMGGMAYNALDDELVGVVDGPGDLYRIDRDTGALTLLLDGISTNDSGLAYDCENHYFWNIDWDGDLRFYDIANGYAETLVLSGLGNHDGLAFVSDECSPCGLCVCPEDLDRDGRVAFGDILRILAAWGPCPADASCDTPGVCPAFTGCDPNDPDCLCFTTPAGEGYCMDGRAPCDGPTCVDGNCPPGFICLQDTCCGDFFCFPETFACENGGALPDVPLGTRAAGGIVGVDVGVMQPRPLSFGMVADLDPAQSSNFDQPLPAADRKATEVGDVPFGRAGVAPRGTLYFSQDSTEQGLWTLSMLDGSAVNVGVTGVTGATVGLSPTGDPALLYGSSWTRLHHVNSDGSGFIDVGEIFQEGLAYDEATSTLYAAINGAFEIRDQSNGGLIATLAAPGADVEGIAFGNGGVYGLARFDTRLFFYDPGTNRWSVVGNTDIEWDLVGLAYNRCEDMLYAKGFQDSFLYRIDPGTGQPFLVGDTRIVEGGGLAWVGSCDPCEERPCPEDLDRDGVVAFSDILMVLAAWGPCEDEYQCSPSFSCEAGDILDDFPCDGQGCFCFTRFDGSGFCQVPQNCGSLEPCQDGDCPPGFVCVVDDCCGIPGGGCVPLTAACDTGAVMPDYPPGTMTQAGLVLPDGSFLSVPREP